MPTGIPNAQVYNVPARFLIEAFDDTNLFVQLHIAPAGTGHPRYVGTQRWFHIAKLAHLQRLLPRCSFQKW